MAPSRTEEIIYITRYKSGSQCQKPNMDVQPAHDCSKGKALQYETTESRPPATMDDLHAASSQDNDEDQATIVQLVTTDRNSRSEATSSGNEGEETSPQPQPAFFPVPIPIVPVSASHTTFAYQRTLLNRLEEPLLLRHGKYDPKVYTPTFVHNILQLPGSLASLLGNPTPQELLHRMTPALLPGYLAHTDPETLQPRLIKSSNPQDYVQGMLILGIGKEGRHTISRHFKTDGSKRKKLYVEIEVKVEKTASERQFPEDRWKLERRTIRAGGWTCKEGEGKESGVRWTLEEYLEGKLEPERPMRVEASARGDEVKDDGWIGREVAEFEVEAEKREVVFAGSGGLSYERCGVADTW